MLIELQRLLALSAALDRPKIDRAPRADTKKNRAALADACRSRAIEPLRRLIAIGAPLNFLVERAANPRERTLLGICASSGWVEGLRELVDAGADEQLIPEFLRAGDGSPAKPLGVCCLVAACDQNRHEAFAYLFPLHGPAERSAALAEIKNASIYLAARQAGAAGAIPEPRKTEMLLSALDGIDPASESSEAASTRSQAFDALCEDLRVAERPELANPLWIRALKRSRPGLLQSLASRGLLLGPGSTVEIVPSHDLQVHSAPLKWRQSKSVPLRWDPDNIVHSWRTEADRPIAMGLASAAAALSVGGSDHNALRALCSIAPLREELFGSEIGLHYLAQISDAGLHRRLVDLGMDLSIARSFGGGNPLQSSIKRGDAKANIEALARLCPEWIVQHDADGKNALDLAGKDRQQSFSILFDQIGMRDAMNGKLGSRKTVATRRRL